MQIKKIGEIKESVIPTAKGICSVEGQKKQNLILTKEGRMSKLDFGIDDGKKKKKKVRFHLSGSFC